MRANRLAFLALIVGAAALAGCDKARSAAGAEASATSCVGCHGGLDNSSGAPPRDTHGNTATSLLSVGAHTKHVNAGLDCEACHVKPARIGEAGHIDGTAQVVFGTVAKLPAGSAAPAYNRASGTCSNVYCHGAKLAVADRGLATTPVWNVAPLAGAPCAACHGSAANAGAPPAPHPAGLALTDCSSCHPGTVTPAGDIIPAVDGGLHINGRPDISGACNTCHGDRTGARGETAGSPANYAPPIAVDGATTGAKVGAHLRHVSTVATLGSRLSQPFGCGECHVMPSNVGPHLPVAVVQFGTLAKTGGQLPSYTSASGTCASNYCHGQTLAGGSASKSVTWTGTAACGTCHFQGSTVAQAAAHPQVDKSTPPVAITANTQCYQCHPGTVKPDGTIDTGLGNHVNGTLEVTNPHAAGWVASSVHGTAAKLDLPSCQPCHGATFAADVGGGKSCNTCHASPATFISGYTGANHPTWQNECTFCHGDSNRAAVVAQDTAGVPAINAAKIAPPLGSQDEVDSASNAVGAHQRHVSDNATTGNRLAAPFKCQQCHGINVLTDANHQGVGHVDGQVVIGWQLAATRTTPVITPAVAAGAIPSARTKTGAARSPAAVSCANYCHGATIAGGAASKTVTWNAPGTVSCGDCHSLPPSYAAPSWHTDNTACATCHGYSGGSMNKTLHVNGTVDLAAGVTCNTCHGSATNAAPPRAASLNTSATTDPRVGAHQKHVTGTLLRATALGCPDCHGTLPTTNSHADGAVSISWSALASTGGLAPSPTAGTVTPGSTSTCANYCHGQKWAGSPNYVGTVLAPSWTSGAAQTACDSCHQAPPASSGHASVTSTKNCGDCHAGYTCTSGNLAACTVNTATHINGTTDVTGLTCTSCHGSATNAAPPVATNGTSTGVKVGAHQRHLTATTLRSTVLACTDCHTLPTSTGHASGIVDMTWGTLARTGALTPTPGNLGPATTPTLGTWEATPSCTNYCHGQKWSGNATYAGSRTSPQWTDTTAVAAACGSCHLAPPASSGHASVTSTKNCGDCHAGYACTTGNLAACTVNTATHINGTADVTGLTCTSCHGSATNAAPPVATNGTSTGVKVGAHQRHLTATTLRAASLTCTDCHTLPTSTSHSSGIVDMTWGTLASTGGLTPTPGNLGPATTPTLGTWEATPSCTNYCHGQKWSGNATYAGSRTSPQWTDTTAVAAACGSCHLVPPTSGSHSSVTATKNCTDCHPGYNCTTGNLAACTVNTTTHINGSLEVNASCIDCHTGTQGTRRAIVPEFGLAWSHKRSAAGAVTKFDCVVCHMEGDLTTGDMDPAWHLSAPGGNVDLRDPDTGLHIKGVTFTAASGASPGSYAPTTTDAVFTQFSRNLGVTLEADPNAASLQAIMINQCLKCHDANGATASYVRGPTPGTATKPFNTTIAGAGYTGGLGTTACAAGTDGCVTNVAASFATTNSSYHPVLGKQNNWYAKSTRMVAPWNGATRGATVDTTSWGPLLSCWDCHADPADTGTINHTVTAHGGTNTLRGVATVTGTPSATNAVTLCSACHAGYLGGTANNHGTGSAFSSSTNGGMTAYVNYGCNICHGSATNMGTITVARPYRAEDMHGTNALPTGGVAPMAGGRWAGTSLGTPALVDARPYAFIRNTSMLSEHTPKVINGTTYSAAQTMCLMVASPCGTNRNRAYTVGGTY